MENRIPLYSPEASERIPLSPLNDNALSPLGSPKQRQVELAALEKRQQAERAKIRKILQSEHNANRNRTGGEVASDTALSLGLKGALGLGEMAYGAADLTSRLATFGKFSLDDTINEVTDGGFNSGSFTDARQIINEQYLSDPLKGAIARVEASGAAYAAGEDQRKADRIKAGKGAFRSFLEEQGGAFVEGVKSYADNPIAGIDTALESALQMPAAGASGKAVMSIFAANKVKKMGKEAATKFLASKKGKAATAAVATRAGLGYVAASEGLSNAVSAKGEVQDMSHEQLMEGSPVYAQLLEQGKSQKEAQNIIGNKVFDVVGAISSTVGAVASKLSGAAKFEGNLFNPNTFFGKMFLTKVAAGGVTGATTEGIEETIQGASGEFAGNVGKQLYTDKDQKLTEGLGKGAASGLVAGSLSGGPVGLAGGVAKATKEAVGGKRYESVKKAKEAIDAGTTAELYDTEKEDYDPQTALAALTDAEEIPETKEGKREQALKIGDHINELQQKGMELLTKDKESKEGMDYMVEAAYYEQSLAALNLQTQDSKEDIDAAIAAVVKAQEEDQKISTEDVDTITYALRNNFSSFKKADGSIDEDRVKAIRAAAPPALAKEIDLKVATQRAIRALETKPTAPGQKKSSELVYNDVVHGSRSRTAGYFKGIVSYQRSVANAVENDNKEASLFNLDGLVGFTTAHEKKEKVMQAAAQAYEAAKGINKPRSYTPEESEAIDAAEAYKSINNKGNFIVGPGTKKVAAQISNEVVALNTAIAESVNLHEVKFGGYETNFTVKQPDAVLPGTEADITTEAGSPAGVVVETSGPGNSSAGVGTTTPPSTLLDSTEDPQGVSPEGSESAVDKNTIIKNPRRVHEQFLYNLPNMDEKTIGKRMARSKARLADLLTVDKPSNAKVLLIEELQVEIAMMEDKLNPVVETVVEEAPVEEVVEEKVEEVVEEEEVVDAPASAATVAPVIKSPLRKPVVVNPIKNAAIKLKERVKVVGSNLHPKRLARLLVEDTIFAKYYKENKAAIQAQLKAEFPNFITDADRFLAGEWLDNSNKLEVDEKRYGYTSLITAVTNLGGLNVNELEQGVIDAKQAKAVNDDLKSDKLPKIYFMDGSGLSADQMATELAQYDWDRAGVDAGSLLEDINAAIANPEDTFIEGMLDYATINKEYGNLRADSVPKMLAAVVAGKKLSASQQELFTYLKENYTPQTEENTVEDTVTEEEFVAVDPPLISPEDTTETVVPPIDDGDPGYDMDSYDSYVEDQTEFEDEGGTEEVQATGYENLDGPYGYNLNPANNLMKNKIAATIVTNLTKDIDLKKDPEALKFYQTIKKSIVKYFGSKNIADLNNTEEQAALIKEILFMEQGIRDAINGVADRAVKHGVYNVGQKIARESSVVEDYHFATDLLQDKVNEELDTDFEVSPKVKGTKNLLQTTKDLFSKLSGSLVTKLVPDRIQRNALINGVARFDTQFRTAMLNLVKVGDARFSDKDRLQQFLSNKLKSYEDQTAEYTKEIENQVSILKAYKKKHPGKGADYYKTEPAVYEKYKELNKNISNAKEQLASITAGQEVIDELLDKNLTSAMAMVSLNWLATEAADMLEVSDRDINSMMNRDLETTPTSAERAYYANVGTTRNILAERLGQEITTVIGIQPGVDMTQSEFANVQMSLGIYAVMAMVKTGHLAHQTRPASDLIQFDIVALDEADRAAQLEEALAGRDEKESIAYVRIPTRTKTFTDGANSSTTMEVPGFKVDEVISVIRDSNGLLDEIFSIESKEVPPVTGQEPTEVESKVRRTFNKITAFAKKALGIHQKRPNKMKKGMMDFMNYASPRDEGGKRVPGGRLLLMAGGKHNVDTNTHVTQRAAQESINQSLQRELENTFLWAEKMESLGGLDVPFWLTHRVWRPLRMGIISNIMNPQTSKVQRHAMTMSDHDVTIDLNNRKDVEGFLAGVGASLGIGTDKLLRDGSVRSLREILHPASIQGREATPKEIANANTLNAAIKGLIQLNNGTAPEGGQAKDALLDTIEQAVAIGGENFYSLDGLMAYAGFLEANNNKESSFSTSLFREADGVTNGVIIGALQVMGGNKQSQTLPKGGLFTDENKHYGEWIAQPGNDDTYQTLARTWVGMIPDAIKKAYGKAKTDGFPMSERMRRIFLLSFSAKEKGDVVNSIQSFVGNMIEGDLVTGFGRALAKDPTMTTSYGAGTPKIINNFLKERIEDMYVQLGKDRNNPEALAKLSKDLSNIVGEDIVVNEKNALTFKLNSYQLSLVVEGMRLLHGTALNSALEHHYGDHRAASAVLNDSMKLNFTGFIMAYEHALNDIKEKQGRPATQQEVSQIHEDLKPLMPIFNARDSESVHDGVISFKQKRQVQRDDEHESSVAFGEGIENTHITTDFNSADLTQKTAAKDNRASSVGSAKVYSSQMVWQEPGVAPVVLGVQALDAAIMMRLIAKYPALNVHDAIGIDILMAEVGAQAINQAFLEVMQEYSLHGSMMDANTRALEALQAYDKANDTKFFNELNTIVQLLSKKEAEKAEVPFDDRYLGFTYEGLGLEEGSAPESYMGNFRLATKTADAKKKVWLDNTRTVDQYTLGEGSSISQDITDINGKSIEGMTDEQYVSEIYTLVSEQLAEIYDEAFGAADIVNNTDNPLGSSQTAAENRLDPADFELQFDMNSENTLRVFDDLTKLDTESLDSPEHQKHLKDLLTGLVSKVIDKVSIYVNATGTNAYGDTVEQTEGAAQDGSIFINLANRGSSVAAGTRMSAGETFLHETIHTILRVALDGNSWAAKETKKLYEVALKAKDANGNLAVTKEVFMRPSIKPGDVNYESELEYAQERYDYIFGDPNLITDTYETTHGETVTLNYDTRYQEFAAHALTNAQFREALAKIDANPRNDVQISGLFNKQSFMNTLTGLIENIFNWVAETVTGTKGTKITADVKMQLLAEQLAGIDHRKKSLLFNVYKATGTVLSKTANTAAYLALWPIKATLGSKIVKDSKSGVVNNISKLADDFPHNSWESYYEAYSMHRTIKGKTEEGFTASFINELAGKTQANSYLHDLNRLSNQVIDQTRQKIVSHTAKNLLNNFKSEVALSKNEKNALTRGILKTDVVGLLDSYGEKGSKDYIAGRSLEDIAKLYAEDGKHLRQEINRIEAQIRKEFKNNQHWFIRMANSLGQHMATGIPIEEFHLMNAHNIASLANTRLKQEGSTELATRLVDELATMRAVLSTSVDTKADVAEVFKRELAADKTYNGMSFLLAVQKNNKEDSLTKLFDGDPTQMVKGYVKDIYNPAISYVIAPANQEEFLAKNNYTMGRVIRKDYKRDPNSQEMRIFINRDGMTRTYMSGIASFTSKVASGTNIMNIHAQGGNDDPGQIGYADFKSINSQKASIIKSIADNSAVKVKPGETTLIPVVDNNGIAVDYRYMMDEEHKISLLEKHDSFEAVLGGMEASIQDKVNSERINKELINKVFENWTAKIKKNSKFDLHQWVAIGPNVQNKRHREIYQMLPYAAREEINKVWGGDTMYVPAVDVNLIFGQRKWSIADMEKSTDKLNYQERNFISNNINDIAYWLLDRPTARAVENVWQEGIKMVKDAIVIKSGGVLVGNVTSNMISLKMLGVPLAAIVKDHAVALIEAKKYLKDSEELSRLEQEVKIVKGKATKKTLNRIKQLKGLLNRNPVRDLIEEGIHQSIIEDVESIDEYHSFKGRGERLIENNALAQGIVDKTPQGLKNAFKVATMQHDTKIYKFMRDATQLSDFAARYVLHKHNMDTQKMTKKESIDMIIEVFIDYDLPTHKSIQYANDMGFFMFSKFFFRTQKILFYIAKNHPESVVANMALQGFFGIDAEEIYDSTLTPWAIAGKFNFNPFDVFAQIWKAPLLPGAVVSL